MESKVSKTFLKVMGIGASIFLTLCAGLFAMCALCCLIMSIVDADLFSAALAVFCGLVAWVLWSVRKDVLV